MDIYNKAVHIYLCSAIQTRYYKVVQNMYSLMKMPTTTIHHILYLIQPQFKHYTHTPTHTIINNTHTHAYLDTSLYYLNINHLSKQKQME